MFFPAFPTRMASLLLEEAVYESYDEISAQLRCGRGKTFCEGEITVSTKVLVTPKSFAVFFWESTAATSWPTLTVHGAKRHMASILLITLMRPCLGQLSTGFLPLVPEVCAGSLHWGAVEDCVRPFLLLLKGGADRSVLGFRQKEEAEDPQGFDQFQNHMGHEQDAAGRLIEGA